MSIEFTLQPNGPFSLAAIAQFQCGLITASRTCSTDVDDVRLAFPLDATHAPVGVRVRQVNGALRVRSTSDVTRPALERQLRRILSLDHDGTAYAKVVSSLPSVLAVSERYPGFRPPVLYSPYAAAGWFVLGQRVRREQATKWQGDIARAAGDVVDIDGVEVASFPRPETFLSRASFPGVPAEKWARLQVVARAALEGQLTIERLTGMPYAASHEALQALHGIGTWTADAVLFRGCGLADAFITTEPQIHHAVQLAYGLRETPDDAQLEHLAESWRPFRTWISVLLTMNYYQATDGRAPTVRARGRQGARRSKQALLRL